MSNKKLALVGEGSTSATRAVLRRKLEAEWKVTILERAAGPGQESSNMWNNAGTGHEALCELNYTPEEADGTINIDKAIEIYNQFQVSKQFWAHLVKEGYMTSPEDFIKPLQHMRDRK